MTQIVPKGQGGSPKQPQFINPAMETVVKDVMFENVTKSEGSRVNVQNAESKVRDTGPTSRNRNSSQRSQNWNILGLNYARKLKV